MWKDLQDIQENTRLRDALKIYWTMIDWEQYIKWMNFCVRRWGENTIFVSLHKKTTVSFLNKLINTSAYQWRDRGGYGERENFLISIWFVFEPWKSISYLTKPIYLKTNSGTYKSEMKVTKQWWDVSWAPQISFKF